MLCARAAASSFVNTVITRRNNPRDQGVRAKTKLSKYSSIKDPLTFLLCTLLLGSFEHSLISASCLPCTPSGPTEVEMLLALFLSQLERPKAILLYFPCNYYCFWVRDPSESVPSSTLRLLCLGWWYTRHILYLFLILKSLDSITLVLVLY